MNVQAGLAAIVDGDVAKCARHLALAELFLHGKIEGRERLLAWFEDYDEDALTSAFGDKL